MTAARPGRAGFTLIELTVVIVIMVIAAAVVAPAFLPPRNDTADSELDRVLRSARAAAADRGETVYVRIGATGAWLMEGASSLAAGPIASGSMADYAGPEASIVVSPIGTCGFDVRSSNAWNALALDPMICEIVKP